MMKKNNGRNFCGFFNGIKTLLDRALLKIAEITEI